MRRAGCTGALVGLFALVCVKESTGMNSPGNVSHSMNHAPLARAVADSFAGYSGPGVENGGKRVARAHRDLVHIAHGRVRRARATRVGNGISKCTGILF